MSVAKLAIYHPDSNQGNNIAARTIVARIDPQDYEVILNSLIPISATPRIAFSS
jgi:hypothetical protein